MVSAASQMGMIFPSNVRGQIFHLLKVDKSCTIAVNCDTVVSSTYCLGIGAAIYQLK